MCLYIKTKTILLNIHKSNMEEKKPLSYVENRMSKPYPTEIGAPKFEPTNISIFKQEKNTLLKSYYTSKFEELTNQWQDLLEDIKINERIYSAVSGFQPVSGHTYHLYNNNNKDFISLISPEEWNNKFTHIGSFRYNSDGRWSKI